MIKKIILVFVCMVTLIGCSPKVVTDSEKQQVVEKFVDSLKNGELDTLEKYTNVNFKVTLPNQSKVDATSFVKLAFEDLMIEKIDGNRYRITNYSLNELVKKSINEAIYVDGVNIAKSTKSDEEKQKAYLEKMQQLKSELTKKSVELNLHFIRDSQDKSVRFDFTDNETTKLLKAILGESS